MSCELPVLNTDVLRDLVGGDDAIVCELLSAFAPQSVAMATELDTALAVGEARAASIAHKLKSAARSVGALRLAAVCEAVERDAKRCAPNPQLRAEFELAFSEMHRQLTFEISIQGEHP